jgi:hypothetical protein
MIFQALSDDLVTSACLGVTCKAFNEIRKTFHPGPISLNTTLHYGQYNQMVFLRSLLYNWMGGINACWDCFSSRFVTPAAMAKIEEKFAKGMELVQAKYQEKVEKDWDRIENRRRDRKRYGFHFEEDRWSRFSALSSSLAMSEYEPTEGTADGDSQADRQWWLEELAELERDRRHINGLYSNAEESSVDDFEMQDSSSEAENSAVESSGDSESDSDDSGEGNLQAAPLSDFFGGDGSSSEDLGDEKPEVGSGSDLFGDGLVMTGEAHSEVGSDADISVSDFELVAVGSETSYELDLPGHSLLNQAERLSQAEGVLAGSWEPIARGSE